MRILLICLINFIFNQGCSSNIEEKRSFIPSTGLTMPEVYHQSMYGGGHSIERDKAFALKHAQIKESPDSNLDFHDNDDDFFLEEIDLKGYTREAHTELNIRFKRLPNPTLILYVFPHLTKENAPIPGYVTTFPMYEVDQYALPGESL